jgi:DNA-binding LacI/PurR family transcriptional regulator
VSDGQGQRASRASRATINDVARACGVSRQTVSNVMRGRGRVGEQTRQRVLATISEVGYIPHSGASSLRSHRTHRLAYPMRLTSELSPVNVVMLDFLQALVVASGERGQQLLLVGDGGTGRPSIDDAIKSGSVDGFVLSNMAVDDPRARLLASRGIPFACFGRTDPHLPQNWVDIDNRDAIRQAAQHLIERGHRRIAFVGYRSRNYWDHEREASYRTVMESAGLPVLVHLAEEDLQSAAGAIESALDAAEPPTAVVTGNDSLASPVYAVAARRGIRLGQELAVTGFDSGVVGRLLSPALTTLSIPMLPIARRLVDRVIRAAEGEHLEPETVCATLTTGDTT